MPTSQSQNNDLIRRVLAEIEKSPGAEALTPAFAERLTALTEGVDVDFDEKIEGEVSLQRWPRRSPT